MFIHCFLVAGWPTHLNKILWFLRWQFNLNSQASGDLYLVFRILIFVEGWGWLWGYFCKWFGIIKEPIQTLFDHLFSIVVVHNLVIAPTSILISVKIVNLSLWIFLFTDKFYLSANQQLEYILLSANPFSTKVCSSSPQFRSIKLTKRNATAFHSEL